MRHVLKLGPFKDDSPLSHYLAIHETAALESTEADSDLEGLRALQARDLGPLTCEPALSSAAAELGLPVDEPPEDALRQRAVIALMTGNPLLQPEVIPALFEFLEVFADFLEFQPWLAMDVDEVLKIQLTKPQRTWEAVIFGDGQPPGMSLCPTRGVLAEVIKQRGDPDRIGAESLFAVSAMKHPGLGRALEPFLGEDALPFFVRIEKGLPKPVSLREFLTLTAALDAATKLALGEDAKGFAGEGKDEVTAKAARLEGTPAAPPEEGAGEKIPRNALCPCGSGKKYKKCHEGQPLPRQVKPLELRNVQRTEPQALTPWRMSGGPPVSEVELSLEADGERFFTIDRILDGHQVQRVNVREQRVVESVTFDLDVPLEQPSLLVDGDRLIIGADDRVLCLSSKDLSPIEQQTLPPKAIRELQRPLNTQVLPGGKYAWSFGEYGGAVVTELATMTGQGIDLDGFVPQFLPASEGVRVFVPDEQGDGPLLQEDGELIDELEAVLALGAPDLGEALVTAEVAYDDDDDDQQLIISVYDPEEGRTAHETIPSLELDAGLTMVSCLDERMVVLQFGDAEGNWAMALARKGDSLETLWRVRVPSRVSFVQDARLRHAVLVARTSEGLRCHRLTREAPPSWPDVHRPPLNHRHGSCPVWGSSTFFAVSSARMTTKDSARMSAVRELTRSAPDATTGLQALAKASEDGEAAEAAAIREALRAKWGDPPGLALQAVGDALAARAFDRALELLGASPSGPLSAPEQAHWHHLRGLALFGLGRIDEAQPEFGAMLSEEGNCEDQGWDEWLEAWRGKGGPVSAWLEHLRAGDTALEAGRCDEALAHYDSPLTSQHGDRQLAARVMLALRGASSVPAAKRRELLDWARGKFETNLVGAWGPLAWPREKLDEARAWLESETGQLGGLRRA